MNEAI